MEEKEKIKQKFIAFVCEWLEEIDFASDYFYDAEGYFDNEILINDFKKTMQEHFCQNLKNG